MSYTPSTAELHAIDLIFQAYMACNACPDTLEWEITPGGRAPATAMGHLAEAGRSAWRELDVPDDARMWDHMVESGENATYMWNWYVTHVLETDHPDAEAFELSDDPYCAEHGQRFDPSIGCPDCLDV